MPGHSAFFADIDHLWRLWPEATAAPIPVHVIGSAALMLRTGYERGTNDGDVLETAELTPTIQERLLALAGPGTPLHARHRLYLQIVRNGVVFLPQTPRWHPVDLAGQRLMHLALYALDVVDVVVSKLKRLSANDRSDIEAMVERGLIPHDELLARFRAAVDMFAADARAEDLPRYVARLHQIERDVLLVDESDVELPPWI